MVPNKKQLANDLSYYNDVVEAIKQNKTINPHEIMDCAMCGVAVRKIAPKQLYCSQRCGKHFADLREKLFRYGMVKR
jgi:predicted nucleic acid-binding Zn ribbon protein